MFQLAIERTVEIRVIMVKLGLNILSPYYLDVMLNKWFFELSEKTNIFFKFPWG